MTAMSADDAFDIVSGHLLYAALDSALTGGLVAWSDFPEIGEHDWEAVVRDTRNKALVFASTKDRFQEAYAFVASRANDEGVDE